MLTLLTALYPEAEGFLQQRNLKKDTSFSQFQLFTGEDFQILITGSGSIASAIAFTHLLTKRPPAPEDLFINLGICGCRDTTVPVGTCFLCNQITDLATSRQFYPDLLYLHPFSEAALLTCPVPMQHIALPPAVSSHLLFDMEASGIYQAGSTFLNQHQLLFLKVVSDFLTPESVTASSISQLMHTCQRPIFEFLSSLEVQLCSFKKHRKANLLTQAELSQIELLAQKLSLSVSLTEQLKQLFRYAKTLGYLIPDCIAQIEHWLYESGNSQCSKKKGSRYLEQFRQFIFNGKQLFVSSYLP